MPEPFYNSEAREGAIEQTLSLFPAHILTLTRDAGIKIRILADGEPYNDASSYLRELCLDVDAWPVPPAGLFVVKERTVYLRRVSPMTVAHEFSHAIDCALGTNEQYFSTCDHAIQAAFRHATAFVTPYAATRVDEYFAECMRAFIEVNDRTSPWPKATRERLLAVDPTMYSIIERIFTT